MSKTETIFICQNCGANFTRWQGRCDNCGKWNTLVEEVKENYQSPKIAGKKKNYSTTEKQIIKFSEVDSSNATTKRFSSSILELDRVLGGGIVKGEVILIGGEPGIGKSTLLTQMLIKLILTNKNFGKVFYVCGEESPKQITLRINRILENEQSAVKNSNKSNSQDLLADKLIFCTNNDVDEIIKSMLQVKPELIIVDSIQTIYTTELSGGSGSVGQIRECCDRLTSFCKGYDIPVFLVGHVTKDGVIAGPKVLEHIVDAVVELYGERSGQLRVLRALKNRFGATDEVGVFKHSDYGLDEVINPTEMFLENIDKSVPGSAIVGILEGTRPILVEVQALVINSSLALPRRVGRGIELSRIQVLAAILQKHSHLPLGSCDVFLSVVGGFKVQEPAADLGLAVAIASSLKNKKLPKKTIFIGEVSLLGEIRNVSYLDKRIKEAKRMGFEHVVSSKNYKTIQEVFKYFSI